MPSGAQKFRQRDIERALRAARAAGEEVARVEVDRDGRMVVILGRAETLPAYNADLEKWLASED